MSRETDPQADPFARMAAVIREDQPAPPVRRRTQPSFAELAPVVPPPRTASAPPVVKRKGRIARSEPLPSIAIAGETRPRQAMETGPELPSVMITKPIASPTVRRQIAAPTVRRARPYVMTKRKKSAVLLFLAFSMSFFALGVAGFFYSRHQHATQGQGLHP